MAPPVDAGYSGTPLPKKLGIKPEHRVLLDAAPDGFESTHLEPLPAGVVVQRRAGRAPYDVVVVFRTSTAALLRTLERDVARTADAGRLWVAWPKRASGVPTDLSDGAVRAEGLAAGVVDVKVCAVDDTWSALCFMRRTKDRAASR